VALIDAETGQRGFIISGEDEFLQPYQNARTRAFEAFDKVKMLTIDNAKQTGEASGPPSFAGRKVPLPGGGRRDQAKRRVAEPRQFQARP